MRRKGFTIIELLVVMIIIAMLAAMLLPALRKARAKATRDKAKNEMAAIASAIIMAKNDIGYYVRICDLSDSYLPISYTFTEKTYVYFNTSTGQDDTNTTSQITQGHPWDGPYMVFQQNSVFSASKGSMPQDESPLGWSLPSPPDIYYGTPLDPWGHPYLVAYDSAKKIMIIYSAGPDGKLQTDKGSTTIPLNSDDLVYSFR